MSAGDKSDSKLPVISAATARRLLLHAQGLLDDPSRRAGGVALSKLINQMGFVQVDTINVIERAHHLTLLSRLDDYKPAMLTKLVEKDRSLFEHWTHDASIIPREWFPHWHHRFERYRSRIRSNAWWRQRIGENPDALIDGVRKRIEKDGPLLSRDFEHDRNDEPGGWWGWKPQKAALEHLWRSGELAVARRINFQKVYDLTERVLPQHRALPVPEETDHIDWACRTAIERLGVATPSEIAGFWHAIDLARARRWCQHAARSGNIVEVMVESADGSKPRNAFALPDWKQRARRVPEARNDRLRLLCPFDPVLRDRKRTQRLFNFDYTFEAFVPAAKRRYGYYVLPIMEGEHLIGRLNPKVHRDRGVLEIKGLWWEPKIKMTKQRKAMRDEAIGRLAAFVGAGSVELK